MVISWNRKLRSRGGAGVGWVGHSGLSSGKGNVRVSVQPGSGLRPIPSWSQQLPRRRRRHLSENGVDEPWKYPGQGVGQRDRKWWVCLLKILLKFATKWPGFLKPLRAGHHFNVWTFLIEIYSCVYFLLLLGHFSCVWANIIIYIFLKLFFSRCLHFNMKLL